MPCRCTHYIWMAFPAWPSFCPRKITARSRFTSSWVIKFNTYVGPPQQPQQLLHRASSNALSNVHEAVDGKLICASGTHWIELHVVEGM